MNMNSNNNQNSPSQSLPQPQSPKHWHGSFGDRYDHHNVWVRGGIPQAYYPRRASASSVSSEPSMSDRRSSSSMSSSTSPSATTPTPPTSSKKENVTPPMAGERRQSGQSPMLFSGLSTQKRNPLDSNMAARRESWKEQGNQGGLLSKWWDGYTKGSSK